MKPDATEQPGIAENQGALRLMQNKMIMVFRAKPRRLDAQLPSHPEMDSDPVSTGKFEQHLFSPREGAQKAAALYLPRQGSRVRTTKNSFLGMDLHPHDFLAEPAIPLPAIEFDFGQFGHGAKYRTLRNCRSARWSRSVSEIVGRFCERPPQDSV